MVSVGKTLQILNISKIHCLLSGKYKMVKLLTQFLDGLIASYSQVCNPHTLQAHLFHLTVSKFPCFHLFIPLKRSTSSVYVGSQHLWPARQSVYLRLSSSNENPGVGRCCVHRCWFRALDGSRQARPAMDMGVERTRKPWKWKRSKSVPPSKHQSLFLW